MHVSAKKHVFKMSEHLTFYEEWLSGKGSVLSRGNKTASVKPARTVDNDFLFARMLPSQSVIF